jgi:hypothetical protein
MENGGRTVCRRGVAETPNPLTYVVYITAADDDDVIFFCFMGDRALLCTIEMYSSTVMDDLAFNKILLQFATSFPIKYFIFDHVTASAK